MTNERSQVFISYSHTDLEWLKRLRIHLKPLVRDSTIEVWDDEQIQPGADWQDKIQTALLKTKVAILLISADFLASDFIAENELPPLLNAAEKEGAIIIPVYVSPVANSPHLKKLAKFQAVNDPAKPLVNLTRGEQEAVFVKVSEHVQLTVGKQELRAQLDSVQERQEKQLQDLEWIIRLTVDLIITKYERLHLQNLMREGPFMADAQPNSTFETELRHLLTLDLIDRHQGKGFRSLFRDGGHHNVKDHFFITERGKKYLELVNKTQLLNDANQNNEPQ